MKNMKALLKEARKLIEENKFDEAQECCKNVLREDKKNFFALVLLGESLQHSEKALLVYQKAISTKPDHPLGWRGLANYYEGKNDNEIKTKLIPVYKEMLKLEIEKEKALKILMKLTQLGLLLKNGETITILLQYLNDNKEENLNNFATEKVIELLKGGVQCEEISIPRIMHLLENICEKDPNDSLQVLVGKVIVQKSNFVASIEEVLSLNFFNTNVLLREWLCSFLCKKYIENNSFTGLDIDKYVDKITYGIENSKNPALLRSMIYYEKGMYTEAYKQCVPLVDYQQPDVTEATFIVKCSIKLKKWSITQKLVTNFLTKVKDETLALELKKYLFLSFVKQQKWKQASTVAKGLSMNRLNYAEQALLATCYIENNESVSELLENLSSTKYYQQLQALALIKQEKYNETVNLLENAATNNISFFYLGCAYWELKQYDRCLVNLLKAAKLDSEHAETFYYLGNYYYMKNSLEKAKKCYEKAYNLNSNDSKTVKKLSETYTSLNLKELDFHLLITAEKFLQTNESWIYFRLGLHYLNKREWENAIINFKNVIKYDHTNVIALECLADAYYSRGSYTSALQAYNKVITMNPNKSTHCFTKIGYIYSLLKQYDDAITTFNKVLASNPSSILALKGIAETWMRIAKKKFTAKLYGSARDCAQFAVDYMTSALGNGKQFSSYWKLMGDCLLFITMLPDKYSYIDTKKLFNVKKDCDTMIRKEKLDIFPLAIVCYSHIAKRNQQLASYDLASAYLDYYHQSRKLVNCNISFNLAITCVKENPTSWRNWNLLGKICLYINKYDLAQHCFIKALMVTRKWSIAKIWCNLGTLYLKLEQYKLANYCFWRGQSTLPSYPQSWIGQAMIAEVLQEEEAMDLFRHASLLGFHPESALGYADWVCRTLKSNKYNEDPEYKYMMEGLYATNYAIDLLEWLCNFEPNNACAYNILGVLQERGGLLFAASKSYEKALQFAEEDKKNIILLNIGRLLLRMGKFEESIRTYKAITEASLNSTCGLALALYKKGLYEESYSVYDTALHWLSNDNDEKAELLVAMAGIMYMFKGAEDAKTILFHSIQITQKKPTAYSLFGICSLGLIHSEQNLTKLALTELQKYEKDTMFGFDIGFLKSYLFVSEGNVNQAIKLLSDSLYDHPNNAKLWFCMAEYCLKVSTRSKVASRCAQRALFSTQHSNCSYDSAKIIATASVAEHISGDKIKALYLAKEGLHMYPINGEIWAALLFSLMPDKLWAERREWILTATCHMRKHMNTSRQLNRWVNLIEKKMGK